MGTHQPIRKTVTPEIPDKLYFRIGDVARLCEVPTYVLRFWETEFPQLKPNKGGTGQRLYRRRDVELALRIKSLLYDQGYTIPGARQVFKNESAARTADAAAPVAEPVAVPIPAAAGPSRDADDSGLALRQMARLRALREEMADLLASFGEASGAGASGMRGAVDPKAGQAAPKVHAMRPRLVLEPRPAAARREADAPNGPRLQATSLQQRDLFGGEGSSDGSGSDTWPEPPAAS